MRSLLQRVKRPDQLALPPGHPPTPTARSEVQPGEFRRPAELGPLYAPVEVVDDLRHAIFGDQMLALSELPHKTRSWRGVVLKSPVVKARLKAEWVQEWVWHLRDHVSWMVGGHRPGERRFGAT